MQSILPILSYIYENYKTTSLGEVARLFHYEPTYLSKEVKKRTGKGYTDIVRELRLDEAKRLLRNTALNMEKVAEQAGYRNEVHFFREFRSEVGSTPGAYRRNQKEKTEDIG